MAAGFEDAQTLGGPESAPVLKLVTRPRDVGVGAAFHEATAQSRHAGVVSSPMPAIPARAGRPLADRLTPHPVVMLLLGTKGVLVEQVNEALTSSPVLDDVPHHWVRLAFLVADGADTETAADALERPPLVGPQLEREVRCMRAPGVRLDAEVPFAVDQARQPIGESGILAALVGVPRLRHE